MQEQIDVIEQAIQKMIEVGDVSSAFTFEDMLIKLGAKPTSVKTEVELRKFITVDARLLNLKEDVRALAFEDDPVLITGETGTGKELIANALHGRRQGKFCAVNCAALPENLLESEMFGHVKGAFTGADTDKVGLFMAANNGTIFLDEIGEMPLSLQAKLLRAIQERRIRRVGDSRPEVAINTRVVCATNRNLKELCEAKLFRDDLYYRLSVFELHIDPLRERHGKDIELICNSLEGGKEFWKACGDKIDVKSIKGNIRELQAMVKRYKVLKKI